MRSRAAVLLRAALRIDLSTTKFISIHPANRFAVEKTMAKRKETVAPQSSQELSHLEHVRKRPAMYVGNTGYFGFIQYLVSAFDLALNHGATWIEFEISSEFRLTSDARLPIRIDKKGALVPFEAFGKLPPRHMPDGAIVFALASSFSARINDGRKTTELEGSDGVRDSLERYDDRASQPRLQLTFSPDTYIFRETEISPQVAHSYCKRMSCLHTGVTIRLKIGDETAEYRSDDGLRTIFDSIAVPYQILHRPIQIRETERELKVEAVFAYHSWTENHIWSFVNKGRVPEGGTHEVGVLEAIAKLPLRETRARVGVLAVLALEYPGVAFEGCIKGRVANPELHGRVEKLATAGINRWLKANPTEAAYLPTLERFQFGALW